MLFYRLLSTIFLPLIYLYLLVRLIKGKEDKSRIKERFGFPSKKKPKGSLFWIHSVSVGESNSALTLAERLINQKHNLNILVTSGTISSASQIKNKLNKSINKFWSKNVIHQYLPVDDIFSVKRFLNHWQPQRAIFIESEIWPNLIYEAKKKNINLSLINARISEKSAKKWIFLHKIGFNILQNFKICLAQSKIDKKRLVDLGLNQAKYLGNLKFCAKTLDFNPDELESLQRQIKNRRFWFVASTHKGEEEIIFKIHQKLKEDYPDILTIIAPRHPERIIEILKIIPDNINYLVRTKGSKINLKTEIYFVDTLGELGLFYKLSTISLIAGSLIDRIGGHNPYEALNLSSIVLSGSNVDNFKEAYEELSHQKHCLMVKNADELYLLLKDKLLTVQ